MSEQIGETVDWFLNGEQRILDAEESTLQATEKLASHMKDGKQLLEKTRAIVQRNRERRDQEQRKYERGNR